MMTAAPEAQPMGAGCPPTTRSSSGGIRSRSRARKAAEPRRRGYLSSSTGGGSLATFSSSGLLAGFVVGAGARVVADLNLPLDLLNGTGVLATDIFTYTRTVNGEGGTLKGFEINSKGCGPEALGKLLEWLEREERRF